MVFLKSSHLMTDGWSTRPGGLPSAISPRLALLQVLPLPLPLGIGKVGASPCALMTARSCDI